MGVLASEIWHKGTNMERITYQLPYTMVSYNCSNVLCICWSLFSIVKWTVLCLQCFDTVGWVVL